MFAYLFEAKSIQSYLFRSGKLKDVISASERLDRLIDNTPQSILALVLKQAQLKSNLLEACDVNADTIGFVRCKGGAFYAYCQEKKPLLALRSLWTLTIQQLFPGMTFCDALCEAEHLQSALEQGHRALAAARNLPSVQFPTASAPCQAAARTGLAAVPLSNIAQREVLKADDESIDLDTELHRQSYQLLGLRQTPLLAKFTDAPAGDENALAKLEFPLDTEDFYPSAQDNQGKEAIRDLALIHVDGNGLGGLLRELHSQLHDQSDNEFAKAFRLFSDALAAATKQSAHQATQWLYKQQATDANILAMRPLVLGGDDITLLCRADLALGFASKFCDSFKEHSQIQLKPLFKQYLKKSTMAKYLTASGGVLYHKSSHPFAVCHHLVEGLCQEAKRVTKSYDDAPAILSFYRMSKAIADDIQTLRDISQTWQLHGKSLRGSLMGYAVQAEHSATSLAQLHDAARFLNKKDSNGKPAALSIQKFRQIATALSQGDWQEADRIYQRAYSLLSKQQKDQWHDLASQLAPSNAFPAPDKPTWYWQTADQTYQTWLADILVYAHFMTSEQGDAK